MRKAMHEAAIPESKFDRTPLARKTEMTQAEYIALRQAAIDKGKLPEFHKWLAYRKITLKG